MPNLTDQQFEKLLETMRNPKGADYAHESLRETNRKLDAEVIDGFLQPQYDDIKAIYGVDLKEMNFSSPRFNWGKFKESAFKLARRMREANSASTFGQLFRVGAQTIANEWYQKTDVTYKSWIQEVTSNKRQEWYPPMFKATPPRRTATGEKFKNQKVAGLDIVMVNYKAGGILGFERELWDDDQTGQIQRRISDGSENMAVMEEAWAYARFIGAATTYGDDMIPASQTKPATEANWPWAPATAALVGGGFNRPASYATFTQALLISAWQQLYNQLDGLGYKMLVQPDTILCSRIDTFAIKTVLNSEYYPVGAQSAGVVGGAFAKNVLKGLANEITSRFMPDKAWALGQSGRGMVFQRRDPVEIIMEAPNSGLSFEQDEMRGRIRSRWEVDWIAPHFWFLGNDGTV